MSDRDWRELERIYLSGDTTVLSHLNAVRERMGLDMIRDGIVHYVRAQYHHRLRDDGTFDGRISKSYVLSACKTAEVWPRQFHEKSSVVAYTPDKDKVTCKSCLRVIRSPKFHEQSVRKHLLGADGGGIERSLCGGVRGGTTRVPSEAGCEVCIARARQGKKPRPVALNARARRRLRRQPFVAGA